MRNYKLIFIFFLTFLSSQSQDHTKEIFFRVIDSQSNMPIAYATVQIKDKNIGIVANDDGSFRIPENYKINNYVLEISCIGYKTKFVELKNIVLKQDNVIKLTPKIELLDQVVINANTSNGSNNITAVDIVRKAILNIQKNYPLENYSTVGYYRDYQVINNTYYNLNEAIIESFDYGFKSDIIMDSKNKNVLYEYVENSEFSRDPTLIQPYDGFSKYIDDTKISGQGGNELGILNIHNPIRNYEHLSFSFVYVFKRKFIDNHKFINIKKVYLNDEILYEIDFEAKESLTKSSHKAEGKIYISKEDYAIHKFSYNVTKKASLETIFEVVVEYKKTNELMYLNYISFNNQFNISDAFKFDVVSVDYDANEKAFYVKFNSKIDQKSIDRKDFKFRYNKKKLLVEDAELVTDYDVKVTVKGWSLPEIDESTDMSGFTYRIKNIYDISNRKIFKTQQIKGYQFREYFTQQIFENKALPNNAQFINKYSPLSEAQIVEKSGVSKYWLNTPLKR
ncbi:carboxypeptidase-like regulatory domain-containing protein [Winogradskyella sp.]|uniref:carboxypeptidase-like regulatory domain-containing protein n=1 Tax=Winogradskyella sp. TaxID=1883156 RepID=UPI0025F1EDC7|nr:carboxypeptidase-like regulatory domain-containing protein [Winogradskyella sp.]